jgi:ubiquinone/menaquinone biosynthesis C-methylase UbiE
MRENSTNDHYLLTQSEDLDGAFSSNEVYAHTYYETKIKAMRELDLERNETVLDVGCGQGHLLSLIRKSFQGTSCVGIDLNFADLKKARNHDVSRTCEFVLADAANLPFRNGSFQRIACTAVLEHVPNERKVMHEMWRILKGNGTCVIDVPSAFHLQNKISDLFIKRQGIFPFHREYTYERMNRLIEDCGFELQSFSTARFVGSFLLPIVETVATFSGRKIVWCRSTLAKIVCFIGDRVSILCENRSYLKLLGGSWFFKINKSQKSIS